VSEEGPRIVIITLKPWLGRTRVTKLEFPNLQEARAAEVAALQIIKLGRWRRWEIQNLTIPLERTILAKMGLL
jgi:hypothetical protein